MSEVRPGSDFGSSSGWFKEHSYLINFAAHVWDRQKASQRAAAERAHASPRGTGPSPAHQRIARHYLTRFHDLCKQCKAELTVVWVPDSRDLPARTAGQPIGYFDPFAELVRGLGLEPVDPIDALVAAGRNGPAVYFEDADHWTPAGHATIAQVLAEQLK